MWKTRFVLAGGSGLVFAFGGAAGDASAATFASGVVSYAAGPGVDNDNFFRMFRNPASALGSPDDITGEIENGFPNVLNPFSPAFETDEIVLIGEAGHLTLRLPNYVNVGGGLDLGVISNAGLQDVGFSGPPFEPTGTNFNPARSFSGGAADVSVSEDGVSWQALGTVTFNLPTNFYANAASSSQTAAPANPQFTDYGKPFAGTLSDFDGEDFAQTLATLDGSGGGTWLDLSATGLSRVGFVRLEVGDYTAGALDRLGIDAVVIANGKVGDVVPVPEPVSAAMFALAGAALLARRRPNG